MSNNLTGKFLIYKGKANSVVLDSFTLGQGNWLIKPESTNLNVKTINNTVDSTLLSIRNGKTVVDISQADSVTLSSSIQIGDDWKVNLGNSGARLNFLNQDSTMISLEE
jgi:hypothetical protein